MRNSCEILCTVVTAHPAGDASLAASEARSTQQATSFEQPTTFAVSSARFEQQQTSNRVNDERISQCLHLRQ